jgi:hypothetical protein
LGDRRWKIYGSSSSTGDLRSTPRRRPRPPEHVDGGLCVDESLIDEIADLRVGAFVPFGQQPWVRAIALLFGGGGSLVLLEYLMLVK